MSSDDRLQWMIVSPRPLSVPWTPSLQGRITMALFSVRTLGFPEIRRDDRLCQLALRKGLALLVYLAEAKGSVGRDVVATMLWPESSRRGRTGAAAAPVASPPAHARRRRSHNRPVDGSMVISDRPAGGFSAVRASLRPRRVRAGLPSLSRRLSRGLFAWRLPAVRRVGLLSP